MLLTSGITLTVIAICSLLFFFTGLLAPFVPFSWEQHLAAAVVEQLPEKEAETENARGIQLQALADRLSSAMDLAPEMTVVIHYAEDDDETVNAFTLLGGHIIIFEGMLQALEDENAVAMVLAHEIAHVKNRDVLRSLSGGILFAATLSLVFGSSDLLGNLGQTAGTVAALHFSRDKEEAADRDAQAALVALYGHAGGSLDLFEALTERQTAGFLPPEFLSSHPDTAARITRLRERAAAEGWALDGPRTTWP